VWLGGLGKLGGEKIDVIGFRTRDHPVCRIVPQQELGHLDAGVAVNSCEIRNGRSVLFL
jgi:hypothetical protein